MAKKSDWLIGILIFGSVLFVVLIFVIGFWGTSSQDGSLGISGSKIGIVEIEGVIFDSQSIVRQVQRLS